MTRRRRETSTLGRRAGHVWIWILVVVAALVAGSVIGCWAARHWPATNGVAERDESQATEQLYTCGMHPNVIQRGPGECPICHMKLTPLRATDDGAGATTSGPRERKVLYWRSSMQADYVSEHPGKDSMGMDLVPVYADESQLATGRMIAIDPVTIQNLGIRTAAVSRGPLVKTIRTIGRVDYNEQTVHFIDTKFEGWIEKLDVDKTGMQVEKGDPLFDVYSPRLYSAQEEFLAALRGVERLNDSTLPEVRDQAAQLVDAARIQLNFFDVSGEQVEQLAQSREIQKTLTIHSPARGIVTEKMALEGMFLTPGMRLYTIADLANVWVYADIYEYQLPWVRMGQEARMSLPYVPDREFVGHVTYIYPYLDKQTRVIKVRLEFDNPELELKPAMYANVTLRADLDRKALLIPREAFIDSGKRKVAFLALPGGKFQPRELQTGVEAEDGMVEVKFGLDEGDRIVVSGQFLLDAESKLKEAIAKMLEPGQERQPVAEDHQLPQMPESPTENQHQPSIEAVP